MLTLLPQVCHNKVPTLFREIHNRYNCAASYSEAQALSLEVDEFRRVRSVGVESLSAAAFQGLAFATITPIVTPVL